MNKYEGMVMTQIRKAINHNYCRLLEELPHFWVFPILNPSSDQNDLKLELKTHFHITTFGWFRFIMVDALLIVIHFQIHLLFIIDLSIIYCLEFLLF